MISKKFYIYILKSKIDRTYYVGYSDNVTRRLVEHNRGKSTYTKGHRPYDIVYTEEYSTKAEAKNREAYIKRYGNVKAFLKSRVPQNT